MKAQERAIRKSLDGDTSDLLIYKDVGSGNDWNREGLQDLLTDVQAGNIEKVFFSNVSRLSRNISDLGKIVAILEQNGVDFKSLQSEAANIEILRHLTGRSSPDSCR